VGSSAAGSSGAGFLSGRILRLTSSSVESQAA
jgi:hypothetical protein